MNLKKTISGSDARLLSVSLSLLLLLCSCFTGIESTKRITLSKTEEKDSRPKDEDLFLSEITLQVLKDWEPGKQFFVTDDKVRLLFTNDETATAPDNRPLVGRTLVYEKYEHIIQPDGSNVLSIVFSDNERRWKYNTGRPDSIIGTFSSMQIPLLIDIDVVNEVGKRLTGRKVWTRSRLWYDINGIAMDGRKFVPVTITGVFPANDVFPLRVEFTDEREVKASVYMNFGNIGIDSRSFASLFSLTDVKKSYPHISTDIWELIRDGSVRIGMTKEECRLSLGNPSDIDSGRDWNFTRELWLYPGGVYLEFEDGTLKNYRR